MLRDVDLYALLDCARQLHHAYELIGEMSLWANGALHKMDYLGVMSIETPRVELVELIERAREMVTRGDGRYWLMQPDDVLTGATVEEMIAAQSPPPMDYSLAERILNAAITAFALEHGAAWEMLLLLQGMAGPTGFYVEAARRFGIELLPWDPSPPPSAEGFNPTTGPATLAGPGASSPAERSAEEADDAS